MLRKFVVFILLGFVPICSMSIYNYSTFGNMKKVHFSLQSKLVNNRTQKRRISMLAMAAIAAALSAQDSQKKKIRELSAQNLILESGNNFTKDTVYEYILKGFSSEQIVIAAVATGIKFPASSSAMETILSDTGYYYSSHQKNVDPIESRREFVTGVLFQNDLHFFAGLLNVEKRVSLDRSIRSFYLSEAIGPDRGFLSRHFISHLDRESGRRFKIARTMIEHGREPDTRTRTFIKEEVYTYKNDDRNLVACNALLRQ